MQCTCGQSQTVPDIQLFRPPYDSGLSLTERQEQQTDNKKDENAFSDKDSTLVSVWHPSAEITQSEAGGPASLKRHKAGPWTHPSLGTHRRR